MQSAREIGIGRLLLELAFEMVLDIGVTKVIARMAPEQTGALKLFKRLGFAQEAHLRDHAVDANGHTHDLLVLSFHIPTHREKCCELCGIPVLEALFLDGSRLCSSCYETRYNDSGPVKTGEYTGVAFSTYSSRSAVMAFHHGGA